MCGGASDVGQAFAASLGYQSVGERCPALPWPFVAACVGFGFELKCICICISTALHLGRRRVLFSLLGTLVPTV